MSLLVCVWVVTGCLEVVPDATSEPDAADAMAVGIDGMAGSGGAGGMAGGAGGEGGLEEDMGVPDDAGGEGGTDAATPNADFDAAIDDVDAGGAGGMGGEGGMDTPPTFEPPELAEWPEIGAWLCPNRPASCEGWVETEEGPRGPALQNCAAQGTLTLPHGCGCQRLLCPEGWRWAGITCVAPERALEDPLTVPGALLQPLRCTDLEGYRNHIDSPACVTPVNRCGPGEIIQDVSGNCEPLMPADGNVWQDPSPCATLRSDWANADAHIDWVHVSSAGEPLGAGTLADPVGSVAEALERIRGGQSARIVLLDALDESPVIPREAVFEDITLCGAPCPEGQPLCQQERWPTPASIDVLTVQADFPWLGFLGMDRLVRDGGSNGPGTGRALWIRGDLEQSSAASPYIDLRHVWIEGGLTLSAPQDGDAGGAAILHAVIEGGVVARNAALEFGPSTLIYGPDRDVPAVIAERGAQVRMRNAWVETPGFGIVARDPETQVLLDGVHINGTEDSNHALYVSNGASVSLYPQRTGVVRGGLSITGSFANWVIKVEHASLCAQNDREALIDCEVAEPVLEGQLSINVEQGRSILVGEGGDVRLGDVAIRGGESPSIESSGRLTLRALSIDRSVALPDVEELEGEESAVLIRGGQSRIIESRFNGQTARIEVLDPASLQAEVCPHEASRVRWPANDVVDRAPGGVWVRSGCLHLTESIIERDGAWLRVSGGAYLRGERLHLLGDDIELRTSGGGLDLLWIDALGDLELTAFAGEVRMEGFRLESLSATIGNSNVRLRHGRLTANEAGERGIGLGGLLVMEDVLMTGASTLNTPFWHVVEGGRLSMAHSEMEFLGFQTAIQVDAGGEALVEHTRMTGAQIQQVASEGTLIVRNSRITGEMSNIGGRPVGLSLAGPSALTCVAILAHHTALDVSTETFWADRVWLESLEVDCVGVGCGGLAE